MAYHRIFRRFGDSIIASPPIILKLMRKATSACGRSANDANSFIKNDVSSRAVDSKYASAQPFNEIPTAGGLPLIGNKLDLMWAGYQNDFHGHIDRRHQRLGPIFRESIGPVEAIFIMAPDLIRQLFLYEGKYPKHPLPEAWNLYNRIHDCKRGLFFMDDEEWLQTRRALMPLLFRNDDRFYNAIEMITDELMDDWKNLKGGSIEDYVEIEDLLASLYHWSIKVIIAIMFGSNSKKIINDLQPTVDSFSRSVREVFDSTAPLMGAITPDLARRYNLKCWQRFEGTVTDSLNSANDIIEYGLQLGPSKSNGLLREMQTIGLSVDLIKRIFIDLIMAAGDTTAYSTQWALYLLSRDLLIQNQIRQEIFEQDHIQLESPLIKGAVREALRMFPVATFIGRILGTDAVLGNYQVNKHSLVLISMFSAGRDADSFPEPNTFMPSRWTRDAVTSQLKCVHRPQSSLPYALGARNCIGQKIANIQMHVILSKILTNFNLKILNKNEISAIMRLIVVPSEKLRIGLKKI